MPTRIKFTVPNKKAEQNKATTVSNTTGYDIYNPVTLGKPTTQDKVPVTPGVPVVEGNGIQSAVYTSDK